MRKQDYTVLAEILSYIIGSNTMPPGAEPTARVRDVAEIRVNCAKRIAEEFARRASVDRAAFLKACGID